MVWRLWFDTYFQHFQQLRGENWYGLTHGLWEWIIMGATGVITWPIIKTWHLVVLLQSQSPWMASFYMTYKELSNPNVVENIQNLYRYIIILKYPLLYCPFKNSSGFSTMDRVCVPGHGHRHKEGNTLHVGFQSRAWTLHNKRTLVCQGFSYGRRASRDCGSQYNLRGT